MISGTWLEGLANQKSLHCGESWAHLLGCADGDADAAGAAGIGGAVADEDSLLAHGGDKFFVRGAEVDQDKIRFGGPEMQSKRRQAIQKLCAGLFDLGDVPIEIVMVVESGGQGR
jgi:hypothetical protein